MNGFAPEAVTEPGSPQQNLTAQSLISQQGCLPTGLALPPFTTQKQAHSSGALSSAPGGLAGAWSLESQYQHWPSLLRITWPPQTLVRGLGGKLTGKVAIQFYIEWLLGL